MTTNWKDIGYKVLWTMVNAGLAAVIVEMGSLEVWWGAAVLAGLQVASAWVRQKMGATPPDAKEA